MYATFNLVLEPPNARLRIIGELDIADEPQLRRNCADLLDCGSGAVSLDLEHLCFIDCSCLRTLDVLRHELAVAERPFEITVASRYLRLVAHLAGYRGLIRSITDAEVVWPPRHSPPVSAPTRRSPRRLAIASGS
jgi:anti-anti-sigma factor